jgi:hypothetical protein
MQPYIGRPAIIVCSLETPPFICETVVVSAKDVVLLVLGAVVGVAAQQSYDWLRVNWHKVYGTWQADRVRGPKATLSLRHQAVRFYTEHGLRDSLYTPSELGKNNQIPILAANLSIPRRLDLNRDYLFLVEDSRSSFPVNNKLLRQAVRAGAVIFGGDILYVAKVDVEDDAIAGVTLRNCDYLAYASLSLQLQRMLREHRVGRSGSPQHKEYLSTFRNAIASPVQPQALGCAFVTLFESGGDVLVAISQRSSKVLNGSNSKGVVPTCGVESNNIGGEQSRYALLFYNFLREFAEEFFDLEELVESAKARRAHPDWILQIPAVESVVREARNGRLVMEHLGVAINPLDGAFVCAVLARFRSAPFRRDLVRGLQANWESSHGDLNEPPIQFISLFDPLLDKWADDGEIAPEAAFALDLARKRMGEVRS